MTVKVNHGAMEGKGMGFIMGIDHVISIISILGSSVITLILSTFFFQPVQDKENYLYRKREYMNLYMDLRKIYFIDL